MTIDTHLQHNLINGDWLPSETGRTFDNVNPANTADVIGAFADSSAEDARAAVSAAEAAGPAWDALGSITRGEILFRAAELMADRKAELGEAVSREQGKLLAEGLGEAQRAIDIVRHIAGAGRRISGSTLPADEDQTIALTWRVPIGVVSLITPWNFPLAIPAWKVAPALLAGCTAILKPSPLAPLSSAILVDIFQAAGVPAGVLNLVQGDRDPGEVLSGDERVRGISFTGSLPVGLAIQQAAVPRLARTQLELGGKNALIVL
ncbi:aldehyde dehydrogenase family protein, partial [Leucobacter sp. M11]|uniref:aldehyde dehydrogenase family protein n=1 Tax=Leucobacter sp. M11 TaxID=2993565 RepID=UPI002D7EE168